MDGDEETLACHFYLKLLLHSTQWSNSSLYLVHTSSLSLQSAILFLVFPVSTNISIHCAHRTLNDHFYNETNLEMQAVLNGLWQGQHAKYQSPLDPCDTCTGWSELVLYDNTLSCPHQKPHYVDYVMSAGPHDGTLLWASPPPNRRVVSKLVLPFIYMSTWLFPVNNI